MSRKQRYTIADFSHCISSNDLFHAYDGFQAFNDPEFCTFRKRTYTDENGVRTLATMALIGPYFYHQSNQVVWARATGINIEYFYGLPTAKHVTAVHPRDRYRIYHDGTLFRLIGAVKGMTDSNRAKAWALTETVINYLFLSRRLLGDIKANENTDVLNNFYTACITYNERKKDEEREELVRQKEFDENERYQAAFCHWIKREQTSATRSPNIKTEESDDDEVASFSHAPSRSSSHLHYPAGEPSLPALSSKNSTRDHAKLARSKRDGQALRQRLKKRRQREKDRARLFRNKRALREEENRVTKKKAKKAKQIIHRAIKKKRNLLRQSMTESPTKECGETDEPSFSSSFEESDDSEDEDYDDFGDSDDFSDFTPMLPENGTKRSVRT